MKEIRVKTLVLRNFKGMSFTLDAAGGNTDVFGANATGKTTLADAFSWLLFDKDSLGRSDFEIKNLDALGEAEHGLEHSVEAQLYVDNVPMTLKKVYKEVWTKKRGSAQSLFTGNTTDHFVNGVPVQKKDYVGTVADLAGDESVFRLLTTPTAFPALHWQKQRAILMDVCGELPDADVIAADSSLTALSEILGEHTIEEHRKVIAARKSEINKQLTAVPVRIDEVKRGLPDVAGLNRSELGAKKLAIEDSISTCQLHLQGVDNGAGIAEFSKELQGLKYDISQLENKYYLEGMQHVTRMNAKINELTSNRDAEARRVNDLKTEISANQARVSTLETELQALRGRWVEIDAEEFHDTTEDTCPACGQALPADRVEEAREKALAHFNEDKAERLLKVETRGKELRAQLDMVTKSTEELHGRLVYREGHTTEDDQLEMLIVERDILKARAEDYSQIPERAAILERKAGIEAQIETARAGMTQDKDVIQKEIADLTTQLAEVKEKIDRFARKEQGTARINELKAEEKRLAAEYEKLEGQTYLCETFVKTKVRLLTERINGLFELARFKLFDTQVNGGISDCCEITVNGIPFNSGLNNAARINAGLDVCRTLAVHFGLKAPIFVDNAESVCSLIDMDAQVIRLVVSESDGSLRVEAAKKRMAA